MKFTNKVKETATTTQSLEDRIRAIRDECDAYLDRRAEQLKTDAPGVPLGVLRNIVCARAMDCPCRAALNNIALED